MPLLERSYLKKLLDNKPKLPSELRMDESEAQAFHFRKEYQSDAWEADTITAADVHSRMPDPQGSRRGGLFMGGAPFKISGTRFGFEIDLGLKKKEPKLKPEKPKLGFEIDFSMDGMKPNLQFLRSRIDHTKGQQWSRSPEARLEVDRGVPQGAPISPLAAILCLNEPVFQLHKSPPFRKRGVLMYADDGILYGKDFPDTMQ